MDESFVLDPSLAQNYSIYDVLSIYVESSNYDFEEKPIQLLGYNLTRMTS